MIAHQLNICQVLPLDQFPCIFFAFIWLQNNCA
jgi:hypothetical protein